MSLNSIFNYMVTTVHVHALNGFRTGADLGFFLGGGAPLRNDITDGEVKKK